MSGKTNLTFTNFSAKKLLSKAHTSMGATDNEEIIGSAVQISALTDTQGSHVCSKRADLIGALLSTCEVDVSTSSEYWVGRVSNLIADSIDYNYTPYHDYRASMGAWHSATWHYAKISVAISANHVSSTAGLRWKIRR